MSCIEDVFLPGDAASCYEITCTVSVCQGGGGRGKIPCIVLLKKALQASQEATP